MSSVSSSSSSESSSSSSSSSATMSLLEQQLGLLESDISHKVGSKSSSSSASSASSRRRKRKRDKKKKKARSEIQQVESEDAKRKRTYAQNVAKISQDTDRDVSIQFVQKVRRAGNRCGSLVPALATREMIQAGCLLCRSLARMMLMFRRFWEATSVFPSFYRFDKVVVLETVGHDAPFEFVFVV